MTDHEREPFETDPRFDRLLDEALSPQSLPGAVPKDLAKRIVARTVNRLPGRSRGVLARIGPAKIRAIAAAIVVAASLGIIATLTGIFRDVHEIRGIERELSELASFEQAVDPIDQEIQRPASQIEQLDNRDHWGANATWLEQEISDYESRFGGGSSSLF